MRKKFKQIIELTKSLTLKSILEQNKLLLYRMENAEDSDVLAEAVLKKGKIWKMEFEQKIRNYIIRLKGIVKLENNVYDPEFDLEAEVIKTSGLLKRLKLTEKMKVKGKLPDVKFEGSNVSSQSKKLVAATLVGAYIRTILHPIAIELLGVKK